MKKVVLCLIIISAVLTAGAQEVKPVRNCRPRLPQIDMTGLFSHRVHNRVDLATSSAPEGENPYIGDRRQLVVMAAFADQPFLDDKSQTLELWNNIFNAEHFSAEPFFGSVHDYFYDQSYGQFRISFDLCYAEVGNLETYHSTNIDDENSKYLVADIMSIIRDRIEDWSPYDWDGDGYIEQLLIVYAGKGQNDMGGSNTIWPHQWWLSKHNNSQPITVNSGGRDYTIDTYCCVQELDGKGGYGAFGTLCHEYIHCFGLPDFYGEGGSYLGAWDIMDNGTYNCDGFKPCGFSAFERTYMGWMTPLELTTDTTVTDIPSLADSPDSYLIRNDGNPQEYYLIENRQNTGWDTGLPGSGIIVFHVDYDENIFLWDMPNTYSRKRYTIFPANNKPKVYYNSSNVKGWAYPYEGNDELTDTSLPAATLNTPNAAGTLFMSKPITGMMVRNGLASFSFMGRTSGTDRILQDSPDGDDSGSWFKVDGRRTNGRPTEDGIYFHDGKVMLFLF